jgi:RNA polymerase sigma factor (sigma-70 family)
LIELEELYNRYAHVIYQRCYSILRNEQDAGDAVQETFARVYLHADTFKHQSSPLTWMYRISTNYCLNQLRNRKGRQQKLNDRRAELTQAPEPKEQTEDHQRILDLLKGEDPQTQALIIYTYFDDCTRQETADLVGLSVPTVRKRIKTFIERARRNLEVPTAALVAAFSLSLWSHP